MNAAAAVSCASQAFVPGVSCEREPTGRGALDGVRLAVKDLIDVGGALTGGGNPDWGRRQIPAGRDAPCVARLRAAGARVVGKTITDELAFSLEGENAHHGTPRHPLDATRLPGGSSSGSAAAVAWNEADVALGTDTGGSVRVPASFCGVWGMRPTHGRVELQGVLPFAPSLDTVGWFAHNADLLHRAGQVLLGSAPAAGRPALRLCIAPDAIALADPGVQVALRQWAARQGITETRSTFGGEWTTWGEAYSTLQGLEIAEHFGPWIRAHLPRFGPAIAPRFEQALELDPRLQPRWQHWREDATRRLVDALGPDEAWLVPAAPCVALARSASAEERTRFYGRALALGALASLAGLPQVVMPLAWTQGLPVGISFIAAPGQDERLLDLALRLTRSSAVPGSTV